MNRTQRFAVAIAAVAVTACGTASADAATPAPAVCHSVGGKTDRRCTPGAINPQVTQANIASTICRKGWTATVRPPVSYTSKLKRQQMRDYGLTGAASGYREDHLIPLEIGGSPTDPRNLWPEDVASSKAKDIEENAMNRAVCNSRIKLADAQHKIVADWVAPGPSRPATGEKR
jgi:hypothetical protein